MDQELRTKRPHIAVINCMMEISDVDDKGQVTGNCLNEETVKAVGLKSQFLLVAEGYDLENCINNLKVKLANWNKE